jgi:hypothetical protein
MMRSSKKGQATQATKTAPKAHVFVFGMLASVLLSGCAGHEAMQWRPKPPERCEIVYSEPQREIKGCISRRQLDDILRQL